MVQLSHGIPEEVVSDGDFKFTAKFWVELCSLLGTEQNMSTAFRPQTDCQAERFYQILDISLCPTANGNFDDWGQLLALAKFSSNSHFQVSIKMTPFVADIGYLSASSAACLLPSSIRQ